LQIGDPGRHFPGVTDDTRIRRHLALFNEKRVLPSEMKVAVANRANVQSIEDEQPQLGWLETFVIFLLTNLEGR